MRAATLTCHPGTPSDAVRGVSARLDRTAAGMLAISYTLEASLEQLRVAPPGPPRRRDRLWEHTCCEIFIARKGLPAYYEFNFAPSGEWAAYAFWRYRDGAPVAGEDARPEIEVRRGEQRLQLDARVRLAPAYLEARLSLALAVVVEDKSGALSYWALRHGRGKPDFHHPEAFALELDEVRD